jgi:hypothetical protein
MLDHVRKQVRLSGNGLDLELPTQTFILHAQRVTPGYNALIRRAQRKQCTVHADAAVHTFQHHVEIRLAFHQRRQLTQVFNCQAGSGSRNFAAASRAFSCTILRTSSTGRYRFLAICYGPSRLSANTPWH